MSEEQAFWKQVTAAAANMHLEVRVGTDGRMGLHHLKERGDRDRPTDDKVETFRQFLARNREMILKANGVCTTPGAYTEDAQRFKAWLESNDAECLLQREGGPPFLFNEERRRLLGRYEETPKWIMEAHRFQKAVRTSVHWSESNGAKPESWK